MTVRAGTPLTARGYRPPRERRARDHETLLWQLVAVISTFDRFVMSPVLVAVALDYGVPLSTVVAATALYFAAYGIGQPFWSRVSERIGIVRTVRLAIGVAGFLSLLTAAAWSAGAFIVFRAVAGGFYGAVYPAALVYIGATVQPHLRQPRIAKLMVGVAMGTASGLAAAGYLAQHLTWRAAFVIPGVVAMGLAWFMRGVPEPDRTRPPRLGQQLALLVRSPFTLLLLALAFSEGAVLLGGLALLPAAVEEGGADSTLAGAVTGMYGVAVLCGSFAVGKLSGRVSTAAIVAAGGLVAVSASATFGASPGAGTAVVVTMGIGLAWTFMHSSLQTMATEVIPEARALVISLFAGMLFAGSAAQAAVVSGLVDRGRFDTIYLAQAVLATILTATATLLCRRFFRTRLQYSELR